MAFVKAKHLFYLANEKVVLSFSLDEGTEEDVLESIESCFDCSGHFTAVRSIGVAFQVSATLCFKAKQNDPIY